MPEHPARTIVVRLGPAGAGVSARVFSQCWMPFGQRRQICCEQVEVAAAADELDDVSALLLPLCVPDLPAVLWARSPRALSLPGWEKLAALARKVIVDSAAQPDARAALVELDSSLSRGMPIGDLAWTRLTRWRETLARLFDNQELIAGLPAISSVVIRHGGDRPPVEAFYLGAWVIDAVRRSGAEASLRLAADPDAAPGSLGGVQLSGGVEASLRSAGDVLSAVVNGVSQCTRLPAATEYLLLREELGIVREDPVFRRTLSTALGFAISS
jgi:glucose-6-phosphate dehydrogenase assembly protein OpcA